MYVALDGQLKRSFFSSVVADFFEPNRPLPQLAIATLSSDQCIDAGHIFERLENLSSAKDGNFSTTLLAQNASHSRCERF